MMAKMTSESEYILSCYLASSNKILMTIGSLMKVKRISECSPWRILQYFLPALSHNWSYKPIFGHIESGRPTKVLLYSCQKIQHVSVLYVDLVVFTRIAGTS